VDDRTLLQLLLAVTVLALALNLYTLTAVRTQAAAGAPLNAPCLSPFGCPSIDGPPANYGRVDHFLDQKQGLSFDRRSTSPYGYVGPLSLNGEELASDIIVTGPDGGERKVFCVLGLFSWSTHPYKPMMFDCMVSAHNARIIGDMLLQYQSGPERQMELELAFDIYQPDTRRYGDGYYEAASGELKCPVLKEGNGDLAINIEDESFRVGGSQELNRMFFMAAPPLEHSNEIQLTDASDPAAKYVKVFGGPAV